MLASCKTLATKKLYWTLYGQQGSAVAKRRGLLIAAMTAVPIGMAMV